MLQILHVLSRDRPTRAVAINSERGFADAIQFRERRVARIFRRLAPEPAGETREFIKLYARRVNEQQRGLRDVSPPRRGKNF